MNDKLKDKLGYIFSDESLLKTALTHSSYANEHHSSRLESNERMEFLGDALLEIYISETLFHRMKNSGEGELTKVRSAIVREKSLAACAGKLGLGEHLLLGKGEEQSGGRSRPSILADAVEALVGAVYLDGGHDASEPFIHRILGGTIQEELDKGSWSDYKSMLQELLQSGGTVLIEYVLTGESGPDHQKKFTVDVKCDGKVIGTGQGSNKKTAEQSAAKDALKRGDGHVL